jgi:hypothetical protein
MPATLPPSGGSSGEEDDGSSYALSNDSLDDSEVEEDLESHDSDSAEETPDAAPLRKASSKRKAPPAELPDSKRKAVALLAELAMSPEKAAPAPATTEDDADKGKAPARKMQLEEKIATCPLLWKEVEALDAQSPGLLLLLKEAFLRIDDAKARELEDKIKMQRMAELKMVYRMMEIKN